MEDNFLGAVIGGAAGQRAASAVAVGHGSQSWSNGKDDSDMGDGVCEGTREQCAVRDGTRGPGWTELPTADDDLVGGKLENAALDGGRVLL